MRKSPDAGVRARAAVAPLLVSAAFFAPQIAQSHPTTEAAKCFATFFVFNTLSREGEGDWEAFNENMTQRQLLSFDMMVDYSRTPGHPELMTNGEVLDLRDAKIIELERAAPGGAAFEPYVLTCINWTNSIFLILQSYEHENRRETLTSEKLLRILPTPSQASPSGDPDADERWLLLFREAFALWNSDARRVWHSDRLIPQ